MINMAILLGRVGYKDTKKLQNGGEVTVLSIATTQRYKDAEGNKKEDTTWHSVNCFSKLSETAKKYTRVGDWIFIRGDIKHKKIESGERAGQYVYSIHANDITFIPRVKADDSKKSNSTESDSDSDFPF